MLMLSLQASVLIFVVSIFVERALSQGYQRYAGPQVTRYRQPIAVRGVSTPIVQAVAPRARPIRVARPVEQYVDESPKPFDFSYSFVDEYGNQQYREEVADANGNVRGRYGYTDANGIYRQVEYTAGASGSQYSIQTNEPGTKTSQPADVVINSEAAEAAYQPPVRRQVFQGPVRQVVQAPVRQVIQRAVRQRAYADPVQQLITGRGRYVQPVQNTYTTGLRYDFA